MQNCYLDSDTLLFKNKHNCLFDNYLFLLVVARTAICREVLAFCLQENNTSQALNDEGE